jgi:hypothetical protein
MNPNVIFLTVQVGMGCQVFRVRQVRRIKFHHSPEDITNPGEKLACCYYYRQEKKNVLAINWDWC